MTALIRLVGEVRNPGDIRAMLPPRCRLTDGGALRRLNRVANTDRITIERGRRTVKLLLGQNLSPRLCDRLSNVRIEFVYC